MKRILTSLWMTCTWASISPGIKVRPPQSMTSALLLLIGQSAHSRTRSFSTSSS